MPPERATVHCPVSIKMLPEPHRPLLSGEAAMPVAMTTEPVVFPVLSPEVICTSPELAACVAPVSMDSVPELWLPLDAAVAKARWVEVVAAAAATPRLPPQQKKLPSDLSAQALYQPHATSATVPSRAAAGTPVSPFALEPQQTTEPPTTAQVK